MADPNLWQADVLLADGGVAHIRAARPDDACGVAGMYGRTSESSMRLRYFGRPPKSSWASEVNRIVDGAGPEQVSLIAVIGDVVVAVASYALVGAGEAEVAFLVEDAHHRRGLGSVLLEHLTAVAQENGVNTFSAEVMAENDAMIAVFREIGLATEAANVDGAIRVVVALEATTRSREVMRARAQRAGARSVARLLNPRSVAVIGASREPGSAGHEVLLRLLGGPFNGPVYPVNPAATHVAGVKAYASITEVPGEVDVAFIATRPEVVLDIVPECAVRGVHALVVLSGGFADVGEAGMAMQNDLVARVRARGMRLMGPAGMGIINTDPEVNLNGTLVSVIPRRGNVAFFAQSGVLSADILGRALVRGMGVSTFASAGNRADISVTDLMHYWISDEETSVVLLYLENFGDPRRFARVARALGRRKPVVAVNAISARDRRRMDAMYGQAGVIRVDSLAEMFDVATLASHSAIPRGNRVAVITNMLSLGEIAEASCTAHQLDVVGGAAVVLAIDAPVARFEEALHDALADDRVDAALAVFLQSSAGHATSEAITRCVAVSNKPVLRVLPGSDSTVPSFGSPEEAIRALAHVVKYSRWRSEDAGDVEVLDDVDSREARTIVDAAHRDGGRDLREDECRELLATYGVRLGVDVDAGHRRMVVEVLEDPVFGRAISLGLADPLAELLDDRAWRALPMTDLDAVRLVEDVGTAEIFDEALRDNGIPAARLHDVIRRVGRLGADLVGIARLRIEVGMGSDGLVLATVAVTLASDPKDEDDGPRRLS